MKSNRSSKKYKMEEDEPPSPSQDELGNKNEEITRSTSSGIQVSLSRSSCSQIENTWRLVMSVFQKVAHPLNGATVDDVTQYLQHKYGDLWQVNTLTEKAVDVLQRSVALGLLEKRGDGYMYNLMRKSRHVRSRYPLKKRRRSPLHTLRQSALRRGPRRRARRSVRRSRRAPYRRRRLQCFCSSFS